MDDKILLGALTFLLSEWGVETADLFADSDHARLAEILDGMDVMSDAEYIGRLRELTKAYGGAVMAAEGGGSDHETDEETRAS